MTKLLVLVLVVGVVLWLMLGRRRRPDTAARAKPAKPSAAATQTMVACTHCGVNLPQTEALFDVAGRPFCSEAHRLQGPR